MTEIAKDDAWYNMRELPPVGSRVALRLDLYDPESGETFEVPYHKACTKGAEVEIVAHFDCMPGKEGDESPVAAFIVNTGSANGRFHHVFQATAYCFKPIDTEAKRIAESLKARKEFVDQLAEDMGYGDDEVHVLYDLYDAGKLVV